MLALHPCAVLTGSSAIGMKATHMLSSARRAVSKGLVLWPGIWSRVGIRARPLSCGINLLRHKRLQGRKDSTCVWKREGKKEIRRKAFEVGTNIPNTFHPPSRGWLLYTGCPPYILNLMWQMCCCIPTPVLRCLVSLTIYLSDVYKPVSRRIFTQQRLSKQT